MLTWRNLTMIRVKRTKVQMIGSTTTVLSELTLAIINAAEILSNQSKLSIEESIDVICNTAKEAKRKVENEANTF